MNFPTDESILVGDIRQIPAETLCHHDILTGGFPCQPFSRLGCQPGVEDDKGRGTLFAEIVRILNASKPRAFILENVPGLATTNNGRDLQSIVHKLEGAGYARVRCAILDSARVLPQRRRRLYLVGFRRMAAADAFEWPTLPNLDRTIKEILQHDGDYAYNLEVFRLNTNQWRRRLDINRKESSWLVDIDGTSPTLTRNYRRTPGKRSGSRVAREGANANSSNKRGGHNLVPYPPHEPSDAPARFFTARECARLQGFPESYLIPRETDADGPGAALFGNAVSPPIIAALASRVLDAINGSNSAENVSDKDCWRMDNAVAVAMNMVVHAIPNDAKHVLQEKIEGVYKKKTTFKPVEEVYVDRLSDGLICFDYRDTGHCIKGKDCRYLHEIPKI